VKQSQQQLVEQARLGCVDSFGELYEHYYNGIVALAYSQTGELSLAEDAAQETFAIACRDLQRLKENNKFAAWLGGICRNVSRQMKRKERNLVELRKKRQAQDTPTTNDVGEAVKDAVWRLRRKIREPIVLRYYDNLSYEQISSILGISQQAVNGRILRAKRKIADHLRRQGFAGVGYANA